MRLWLVENDYYIIERIAEVFSGKEVDVDVVRTESEFDRLLLEFSDSPDLVILDVMFPWCSPGSDTVEPPEEVKRDGWYTAGTRCFRALRRVGIDVPVIFHTALAASDLLVSDREKSYYLPKDPSDLRPLDELVRLLVRGDKR